MNQDRNRRFDPQTFQKVLKRSLLMAFLPLLLAFLPIAYWIRFPEGYSSPDFLGFPLLQVSGEREMAVGWVAMGGYALGVLAVGGCSVGLFAIGGGSFGLFAIGGGAIGLIAVGGYSVGYIAIGGGGFGKYVLAGGGLGRYVLTYKRQDRQAAVLFCRYLKALRKSFPRGVEALEEA